MGGGFCVGGNWWRVAAVGGRTPPSREPSGIFERHPPVYAVGFLYRVRGAAICDTPPARKSGKLHSGRIPQAGTTEPAHWRVIEFSEAIKKSGQPVPCVGVAARLVALWVRYSALAGGVCRRTHGNIWRCRRGRNPRRLQDPQCLPCAPCRSPGNGCKRCLAQ